MDHGAAAYTRKGTREECIAKMLAADCHVGTKVCDPSMRTYVWRRRSDTIHIINVAKTYEKLMLAARVIVAIENPKDVIAISARPYGQRAVLKFAHYVGADTISGRFTPGTFTNQITRNYREPRLLIVTDPRMDHQPVNEALYVGLPVIAFCDSDASLKHVDLAIPANNKGKHSIGLLYWLLAREVLMLRGSISRDTEWDVAVDLFFYRDPEEIAAREEESKAVADYNEWDESEKAGHVAGALEGTAPGVIVGSLPAGDAKAEAFTNEVIFDAGAAAVHGEPVPQSDAVESGWGVSGGWTGASGADGW